MDRNYKERPGQKARPKSLSARRAWIEIKSRRCVKRFHASLSARRAWIEIAFCVGFSSGAKASLSARRAWIEIYGLTNFSVAKCKSLSARRAWIEISKSKSRLQKNIVALRKESVDRNLVCTVLGLCCDTVALRKESVDRNLGNVRCLLEKCRRSPQGERG